MTASEQWAALSEPFDDIDIKSRPGSGGMTFRYVDARTVAQRLDDILTPDGWSFTWTHIPGEAIVHGHLEIGGVVREDAGYPNSDRDEEPMKAAVSDALKRCAVLFGVGRHLYEDNAHSRSAARPAAPRPTATPSRPHVVDTSVPETEDWLPPADAALADDTVCPEHGAKWIGDGPTDWYHRKGDGGYCRHPMNKGKRASAR